MKSPLRFSKASGTTKQKVNRIIAMGERFTRRHFVAARRNALRALLTEGGCDVR